MDKIEPVAWMYTDKQGIFQLSTDKRNPDAAYWTEEALVKLSDVIAHPAQHDAGAVALASLLHRIVDDHMTSDTHHPNHILINRADFEGIVSALAALERPEQ